MTLRSAGILGVRGIQSSHARRYAMPESYSVATETADAASNPEFTSSNCGSEIGSATGGPLYPRDGKASINGNTDLSQCIKGQRGSHINSIAMETYKGVVYR